MRLASFEDAVGMPDGIFERPATEMGGRARAACGVVGDLADAVHVSARRLGDEAARPAVGPDQVAGDVPKLGRKILVGEQNVHRQLLVVNR
jgi:hypothetical protein